VKGKRQKAEGAALKIFIRRSAPFRQRIRFVFYLLPFAFAAFILLYFDRSALKFSETNFSRKPMKFKNSSKIIFTMLALACAVFALACPNSSAVNNTKVSNSATTKANAPNVPDVKPPTMTDVPVGNAQTPSEAYRMLFAAVKSQDPAKIKSMLSKGSMGLAEMASGQQKKPIEEVIKNGFTETTFVDDYPQIRDQRIKGNFGAVEVWNATRKQWDDIPFILEDGSWKAAFGDAFGGKWQSPGKGQAVIEQENANANNPNGMIQKVPAGNANASGNFKSGGKVTKPQNQ
jgi:hypothetical protein